MVCFLCCFANEITLNVTCTHLHLADRRPKAPPTSAPAPCLHRKQHLDRARYIIRGEGKRFEGKKKRLTSLFLRTAPHHFCPNPPMLRLLHLPQHRCCSCCHPFIASRSATINRTIGRKGECVVSISFMLNKETHFN